jgi:hypothetical protein
MGYPHYTNDCFEHWKVATICGSMRFYEHMLVVAERLTLEGWMVLMPFVRKNPSMDRGNLELQSNIQASLTREGASLEGFLDDMHKRKIDLSRVIHVVSDESGYIGESTRSEIEYAAQHDKRVVYEQVGLP